MDTVLTNSIFGVRRYAFVNVHIDVVNLKPLAQRRSEGNLMQVRKLMAVAAAMCIVAEHSVCGLRSANT
jgi:hypothetical protein